MQNSADGSLATRTPDLAAALADGYLGEPEQNWSIGTLIREFTARTHISCTITNMG